MASEDSFFGYLARLIPGGPVTFSKMFYDNIGKIADASMLQAGDMHTAIMCGVEQSNRLFFAMRIIDEGESKPTTLVFISPLNIYPALYFSDGQWEQCPNQYWPRNLLRLHISTVRDYIVCITKGNI